MRYHRRLISVCPGSEREDKRAAHTPDGCVRRGAVSARNGKTASPSRPSASAPAEQAVTAALARGEGSELLRVSRPLTRKRPRPRTGWDAAEGTRKRRGSRRPGSCRGCREQAHGCRVLPGLGSVSSPGHCPRARLLCPVFSSASFMPISGDISVAGVVLSDSDCTHSQQVPVGPPAAA